MCESFDICMSHEGSQQAGPARRPRALHLAFWRAEARAGEGRQERLSVRVLPLLLRDAGLPGAARGPCPRRARQRRATGGPPLAAPPSARTRAATTTPGVHRRTGGRSGWLSLRPPPRDGQRLAAAAAPQHPACWGPASRMAVAWGRRGGPALLRGLLGAASGRACSSGAPVRAPSAAAQVRRGAEGSDGGGP